MTSIAKFFVSAVLSIGLAAPALAEMNPGMTCLDFVTLNTGNDVLGQQDATKMLKAAAAEAGTLPAKLAETQSVVGLAEAIANRCSTKPEMLAMDAMLEGN